MGLSEAGNSGSSGSSREYNGSGRRRAIGTTGTYTEYYIIPKR